MNQRLLLMILLSAISILASREVQGATITQTELTMTVVEGQSTRSIHAGGANFVFADGSVRSINQSAGGGPHVRVFSGADSTELFSLACSDAEISEATLTTTIRDDQIPDEETYFIIRMKPVYISSYQTGGSSGDTPPVEELTLNFEEIEIIHRRKLANGEIQEVSSGVHVCLGDGSVRFK